MNQIQSLLKAAHDEILLVQGWEILASIQMYMTVGYIIWLVWNGFWRAMGYLTWKVFPFLKFLVKSVFPTELPYDTRFWHGLYRFSVNTLLSWCVCKVCLVCSSIHPFFLVAIPIAVLPYCRLKNAGEKLLFRSMIP